MSTPTLPLEAVDGLALEHQPDHLGLIGQRRTSQRRYVDAIIVPATRGVHSLEPARALAAKHGCVLLLMCSRGVRASEVAEAWANQTKVRWAAIDVPADFSHPSLNFSCDKHRLVWDRNTDLSLKRNLGLMIARMRRWNRIFFLDDDVVDITDERLALIGAMLGKPGGSAADGVPLYSAVGNPVRSFPDNSVVCHANRIAGNQQNVFVSGSTLGVYLHPATAFFPNIYNEDWLFLIDDIRRGSVGEAGSATQLEFDPFEAPERARSEEFGDLMAEALMTQLEYDARTPRGLGRGFWRRAIAGRRELIEGILVELTSPKVRNSLVMALKTLDDIAPEDCQQYLGRWQSDLDRWEKSFKALPWRPSIADAVSELNRTSAEKLTCLFGRREEISPRNMRQLAVKSM